jgi:drug/metabolite transporter (DMT)-like permease
VDRRGRLGLPPPGERPGATVWAAAAAALASVFFGGMVFSTRFVVSQTDPLTLAFLRCAIGAACLLPMLAARRPGVRRADLAGITGLGVVLYALMPVLLAFGLQFTYASRGALVLASQPLLTLGLARWRGQESLTPAKLAGIAATIGGLGLALAGRPGATDAAHLWVGDLILLGAALCVAVYTVYARPYLGRYSPIVFTALTMTVGAVTLAPVAALVSLARGLPAFTRLGWAAVLYIGIFGAAAAYSLWVWALERTTPTRVAIFLTLNPLTATLLGGTFLDEPITSRFLLGLAVVLAGVAIAHGR